MRCGNCGITFDASGTYASGGSCPGCGSQMSPQAVFEQTSRSSGPSSGAPPLSAGGWGGRPRYRIGSSISEIVEGTFRVWGQTLVHNGLLQCIPLAISVPLGIAGIFVGAMLGEALDAPVVLGAVVLTIMSIVMTAHAVSYMGSFVLLDDVVRQQGEENLLSAFGTGVRRIPGVIGLGLLALTGYLLFIVLPTVGLVFMSEYAAMGYGLLLVVPMVIAALRLSLVLPAMMVEELGPIEAIVRSIDLTKGQMGTIFVTGIIIGAINAGIFFFLFLFSLLPLIGIFASIAMAVIVSTLATTYSFTLFAGLRDAAEDRIHGEV